MCLCLLTLGGGAHALPSEEELWQNAARLVSAQSYEGALPLLEKLVSLNPRNKHYRFNLALALFHIKKDGRARYHLEQVRGTGLEENERVLVNNVLAQIDSRKTWSGYFSLNVRPETNGTKQTEADTIAVGGLPFTLSDTAIGKPTTSAVISTGFTYAPSITETAKFELSLGALLKHNSDVSLRDYQITARAGVGFAPVPSQYWSGGLSFGKRRVADRAYSDTGGLYINHARRVGKAGLIRFGGDVSRAFRTYGRVPVDRTFAYLGYTHSIGGNVQLSFSAFGEVNDTEQLSLKGFRRGISATGRYAFKGGIVTSLTLGFEADDRDGLNQIFGVRRQDRKKSIEVKVHHRDFRIGAFAPELQFGLERNKSNIPLADYTNRFLSVGLTRKF